MAQNKTNRIREYASTIGILILLAGVLGFYYLRYVPERRGEFNQAAFLELNQIEFALQFQNSAYHDALKNIIQHEKIDIDALAKFNLKPRHPKLNKEDSISSSRFLFDESNGEWQLCYPVYDHKIKTQIYSLSKNADTLMYGLVSTYKDVFDGYLLINNDDPSEDTLKKGATDKGEIIFQSGDLYMSSTVNPDSLLNKNSGLSLNNLQDITIEGNSYKLFLYPFEMGSQKLILAGLIRDANYREANLKIPFSFFSVLIVLLLLLMIHLPILRIYILGQNERIRERDIRLIMGSYFIAAFFGFFLFTKLFLDKEQAVQNKNNIKSITHKIIDSFQHELGAINRQLDSFDSTLALLPEKKNLAYLNAMSEPPRDSTSIYYLDSLFKAQIYPYSTIVFWLDSSGNWVARWGFKKGLTKSSMISVKDRTYFKDFENNEPLSVPGVGNPITIQPTLSKLEGDYVVTVAKRSSGPDYKVTIPNPKDAGKDTVLKVKPFLIGMATEMLSVNNVVMPPGYNFSIIDETGQILYDSKSGRPLLSNIFKEMEDPGRIQQSAHYRNTRYFESLRLRSKNMSLLSTPIDGMPYQLLVYFNRFRSDAFEEHLITLSAGLIGAVICLVIFSSLINRWSKGKNRMLESRSHHFEWLHPSADPLKRKYYLHLIRWMLLLLSVYLLAWVCMESWLPESEFSILFISLLFPFYIAVFYYELRERFYDVQEKRTDINWYYARPSLVLRGVLLIIIILINCLTSFVKLNSDLILPVLFIQLIWVAMIALSAFRFRHFLMTERKSNIPPDDPSVFIRITRPVRSVIYNIATQKFTYHKKEAKFQFPEAGIAEPIQNVNPESAFQIPKSFVWAILIGVTLISIIPASGIFWLFFRQENGLYQNTDQMIMAKEIDERARGINQSISDFKYNTADTTDRLFICRQKFSNGIYMISGQSFADITGTKEAQLVYPANEYIQLHDQVFPGDSLVLNWIDTTDAAADSSWVFAKQMADHNSGPELLYRKRRDGINPGVFRLTSDPTASRNTAGLIGHSFSGTGRAFSIFFIVGLCFSLTVAYFLTLSLAKRIFLVELQDVVSQMDTEESPAGVLLKKSGIQPSILSIMVKTNQQIHPGSAEINEEELQKNDDWLPGFRDIYLFEKKLPLSTLEAQMPALIETLRPVYSVLWKKLSERHKFILYDFSQDGFANYKAGKDLQALIDKGLLFFEDLHLCVMTLSFQEYVLQMKEDPDLNTFLTQAKKEDTWKRIQTPLLILMMSAGIFIFATQEEVYKKITGLITSLTSLLPMLSGMFGKSSGKSADS